MKETKKYNTIVNYDTKINMRINSKKLEQFREIAKKENISYTKIVRNLIEEYINDHIDCLTRN